MPKKGSVVREGNPGVPELNTPGKGKGVGGEGKTLDFYFGPGSNKRQKTSPSGDNAQHAIVIEDAPADPLIVIEDSRSQQIHTRETHEDSPESPDSAATIKHALHTERSSHFEPASQHSCCCRVSEQMSDSIKRAKVSGRNKDSDVTMTMTHETAHHTDS